MRIWKKGDAVRDLVFEHLSYVRATLLAFREATYACLAKSDFKRSAKHALEAHRAEGKADDVRRTVEKAMIAGALLPRSRRQIFEIVDRADTLANAAEASVDGLLLCRVIPPDPVIPFLLEITEESLAIYEHVECAIRALFTGDLEKTAECAERIDQGEARVDHLEREALKTLFSLDIDLAEKLHSARYLDDLVTISDRAEDLADQLALIAAEGSL